MGTQPTLTHYDFANIRYSSFYSTGFLLNAPRFHYRFEISRKPPRLLGVPEVARSWRQDMNRDQRLLYRYKSDTDDFFFCIDTLDHNLNYSIPVLQNVGSYFKVNYRPECLPRGPDVDRYVNRIQPILPFFPLRDGGCVSQIPRLMPSHRMGWGHRAIVRRIVDEPRVPTLDALKTLRGSSHRYDVFFVSAFYPAEPPGEEMVFRYRVMIELEKQGLDRVSSGSLLDPRFRSRSTDMLCPGSPSATIHAPSHSLESPSTFEESWTVSPSSSGSTCALGFPLLARRSSTIGRDWPTYRISRGNSRLTSLKT